MEENEKYWRNLLEEYKNGTISNEDRHALEKKALDDSFLFDALEGYELHNKKKKRRLFPYLVAASVVAVLSVVALWFFVNNNGLEDKAATYAQNVDLVEDNSDENIDNNEKEYTLEDNGELPKPKVKEVPVIKVQERKEIKEKSSVELPESEVADVEQGAPLPEKTSDRALSIKEESSLSQESLQIKRSKEANRSALSKDLKQAMPLIGTEAWEEYVKKNIAKSGLEKDGDIEIIITFYLDEYGEPTNFKKLPSECEECSAYAITLLQNAGVWQSLKGGYSGPFYYKFIF